MKQYWTRFRALSWWKQALGWVVASIVLIFVAGSIGAIVDPVEEGDGGGEATTEAVAKSAEQTTPSETPTSVPTETAAPEPEGPTFQGFGEDQFGGKLTGVEPIGGKEVIYTFHQGDTIDYAFTIEEEMKDAYQAAYDDNDLPQANTITIIATVDLIDRFGKESTGYGYSTTMTRNIGEKIDWGDRDLLEFGDLWEVNLMRDDL